MPRWSTNEKSPLGIIRMEAGYPRETVAAALKLSLSTLIRYETGSTDIPIGIVEDMATLYKVPFDTLREAIKETKSIKGVPITGRQTERKPYVFGK